jgi:RHS repeat-associated protein
MQDKFGRPGSEGLVTESGHSDTAKDVGQGIYYYHNDPNGSPVRLTNEQGQLAWSAIFLPWGRAEHFHVLAIENPIRFQGQYYDAETGLHYNLHRYYSTEIGYIAKDPIGLEGGVNLYQFAPNPLTWIDPWGLTKAPVSLPEAPGIYILTNGRTSYVGSAGIGKAGMNKRMSSLSHKKAQRLLDMPGTTVQYVRVNLGAATTRSDRNNILRYYEAREFKKQQARGFRMLNGDGVQSKRRVVHALKLIKTHGASASSRRTKCR